MHLLGAAHISGAVIEAAKEHKARIVKGLVEILIKSGNDFLHGLDILDNEPAFDRGGRGDVVADAAGTREHQVYRAFKNTLGAFFFGAESTGMIDIDGNSTAGLFFHILLEGVHSLAV